MSIIRRFSASGARFAAVIGMGFWLTPALLAQSGRVTASIDQHVVPVTTGYPVPAATPYTVEVYASIAPDTDFYLQKNGYTVASWSNGNPDITYPSPGDSGPQDVSYVFYYLDTNPDYQDINEFFAQITAAPPTLSFDSLTPGAVANGGTVSGSGTAADAQGGPVARVEVSVDDPSSANHLLGDATLGANSGFSFSFPVPNLAPGIHQVWVRAYDSQGNFSSQYLALTVNNTPPTATLTADKSSAQIGQTVTLTLSGADIDGNLMAVNLWVKTPNTDWRNIRADSSLNSGYVENATTDNAISSGGQSVGSLGPANRTFTFTSDQGEGTYEFDARSIDGEGAASATAIAHVVVGSNTPATILSASTTTTTYGTAVVLTSATSDPTGNLVQQAVDYSIDNVNWTSGLSGWLGLPAGTTSWSGSSANNTLTIALPATLAAGTYYFRARGQNGSGVSSPFSSVTLTVSKAPLTVTAINASRSYGAANPTFSASYSGFVNGETSSVLSGVPSFSTDAALYSPVGPYIITPVLNTLSAANYSFTLAAGVLTVTAAPLTIRANDTSRTYGAPNPAFSASYAGFVNGDTSTLVSGLRFATTATISSPSGNYAITPSGAGAPNYAIAYQNGTLTINKASQPPVAVSPGSATITAGATITLTASGAGVGGYSWSGTGGASGTGSTKSVTFPNPGSFTVTAQSLGDGNYQSSNTATVNVSVVQASGLVGSLGGDVSVDNKGAANYSIPLLLPPGRAGMEPKLSLDYSSQSGNGPLGIGWSLSTGFPQSITRGRTILARDGITRGVVFDDAKDKFYLDGKRLLCVSGTYGAPGSQYHTEVDSFETITTSGSSTIDTFTVTDKFGTKMVFGKYGSTVDGWQPGFIRTGGTDSPDTLAYAWALKHVEDAAGNSVDLAYTTNSDGESVLSQIAYTGSTAGGPGPAQTVQFFYNEQVVAGNAANDTGRMDRGAHYIGGRRFAMSARLDRIDAQTSVAGSNVVAERYQLGYEYAPSFGPTRLVSVSPSFCDPRSHTLVGMTPTVFAWSNNAVAYTTTSDPLIAPAWNPDAPENFAFGDVNGDGRDDLVQFGLPISVGLSNGTGITAPVAWISLDPSFYATPTQEAPFWKLADVNGDGKKDIVFGKINYTSGQLQMWCLVSNGTKFVGLDGSDVPTLVYTGTDDFGPNDPAYAYARQTEGGSLTSRITVGDFTGDGREGVLIHRYDGQLRVLAPQGTTFAVHTYNIGAHPVTAQADWGGWFPYIELLGYTVNNISVQMMPCDLNGDGITDYAWIETTGEWNYNGPEGQLQYSESRTLYAVTSLPGGGFSQAAPVDSGSWQYDPFDTAQNGGWDYRASSAFAVFPCDINGDGLTDFLIISQDGGQTVPASTDYPGAISGRNEIILSHRFLISKGSNGTPQFEVQWPLPNLKVNVGGTQTVPWFDKLTYPTFESSFSGGGIGTFFDDSARRTMQYLGFTGDGDGNGMFDVNGDGRDDFVWYVPTGAQAGWWVMYALDGTYSAPQPVPLGWVPPQQITQQIDHRYVTRVTRMALDLNGDGVKDFAYCSHYAYQSPGIDGFHVSAIPRGNKLVAVYNGIGGTTTIGYKPITDDSIYTQGAAVSYPIRELRNATYVVSDLYKDSGDSIPAHFTYQYSGNRLDLSGRGALGFHSFVTLDTQTDLLKYQFLAQSFPMTGLAQREQTYRAWTDANGNDLIRLITSHDNTVVFDRVSIYPTLFPFISKAVESRWEDSSTGSPAGTPEAVFNSYSTAPPANPYVTITAESWFDNESATLVALPGVSGYWPSDINSSGANVVVGTTDATSAFASLPGNITYGNLTRLKTDYGSGLTETAATAYKPPFNGITGAVDTETTTVTSSDYGTQTAPTKSYTYWNNTPLPLTESVQSSDSNLSTTTTYSRSTTYPGVLLSTTVAGTRLFAMGAGSQSVIPFSVSDSDIDPKFELPKSVRNAYDDATTTTYDQVLGKPASIAGPNGDTTSYQYDALGRSVLVTDPFNLNTATTYAWTTPDAADWTATQSVAAPTNLSALSDMTLVTGTSVFAVRVAPDYKSPVTSYCDRLGRTIRTIKEGFNGTKVYTDTVYDVLGRVAAVSLPYASGAAVYWTQTHYDKLGRVDNIVAPNGTKTATVYNGLAKTVTVTTTDSPAVSETNATVVNAKGQTVATWNANNVTTFGDSVGSTSTSPSVAFKLDGFGRMRETDLNGQSSPITATYDDLGRQTSLNDPDKGNWLYINSALGYVLQQTDARQDVTSTRYDVLGRPLTRTTTEPSSGPIETADWFYYDSTVDAASHRVALSNQGWIGALEREDDSSSNAPGYAATHSLTTTTHYYDPKGRPQIDLNGIDGAWFYTYTSYDTANRVQQVQHYWRPAGFEAGTKAPYTWRSFGYTFGYDSKSYMLSVTDTTPAARVWWAADTTSGYDYLDRPVLFTKGGAQWTERTYRPTDGLLSAITTGPSQGAKSVQNLNFNYDGLGNLTSRTDGIRGLTENLGYDSLNRLTSGAQGSFQYADNGNITSKIDVAGHPSGAYTYDSVHLHAVASAWGYAMTYDADGNIFTRTKSGTGESWNFRYAGFDKPRWMAKTVGSTTAGSEFLYNADRSRILHLEFDAVDGSKVPSHYVRKRVYGLGSTVEVNYTNSVAAGSPPIWQNTLTRIYVPGPDGVVGTEEFTPSTTVQGGLVESGAYIYHYDHLSSIEAITPLGSSGTSPATTAQPNTVANAPGLYSEDAWGQRRDPLTWSGPPTTTDVGGSKSLTPRGYTGHEMLDGLGLVHMNGRIYDPLIGRMLSADILVQNPASLQEYNRYSYVRNNPLSLTDPTGWFAFPILPMWIDPNTAKETPKAAANFTVGVVGGLVEANSTAKIDTTGNLPATAGKVLGNALGVAEGTGGVMLGGGIAGGGGALAPVTGGLGAAAVPVGVAVAGTGATVAVNASHKLGDSIQQLRSEARAASAQPSAGSDGGKVSQTPPTEEVKGGVHSETRLPVGDGKDSHHMPARDSNGGMPDNLAPSIKMDPVDHAETLSNGQSGPAGAEFRASQAELWNSGDPAKVRQAMANEIKDVRRAAGEGSGNATKYNPGVQEMLNKAKRNGVLPDNPNR